MENKALNYMVCCANGAGTSLMAKMTLQKTLDKVGLKAAKLHHCSLSEGKSAAPQYDVVVCSANFANMFDAAKARGTKVIGLKNILSVPEMEAKFKEAGLIE